MASKILHKRSSTVSAIPAAVDLELGELALNTADGKIYMKKGDNSVVLVGGATSPPIVANNDTDFAVPPTAAYLNAIAVGNNASSGYAHSIAIGTNAVTSVFGHIAMGRDSKASSTNAIGIGNKSEALGGSSTALGYNTVATGSRDIVIGVNSTSGANADSIIIGNQIVTSESGQIAIGSNTDAAGVTTDTAHSVKLGRGDNDANKNMLHLFGKGKLEVYGTEAQYIVPTYATSSEPLNPVEGSLIYDSTLNALKTHDSTSWFTVSTLDSAGKIPTTQLPGLALTTVNTVASEIAQVALTAEQGDVAIRTDLNKTYAHNGGVAGTIADWSELLTPTDVVTSVASKTGAVTLDVADVTDALDATGDIMTGNLQISKAGPNLVLKETTANTNNVAVSFVDVSGTARGYLYRTGNNTMRIDVRNAAGTPQAYMQMTESGTIDFDGEVTSNEAPTAADHLTRKDYVDTIATHTSVPATATSTGTTGQIATDGSFFYVCTATNTWVRAALSTWT